MAEVVAFLDEHDPEEADRAPASAHAMKADVTVGERVKLVAYYDDDTPAESAAVTVTDAEGKEVFAGATDERGVLTFARPAPGRYGSDGARRLRSLTTRARDIVTLTAMIMWPMSSRECRVAVVGRLAPRNR